MRRHGFSLVEVLVVIAVIGLLMAVLLPYLSLARRLARSAKCASNLHQIGIVFNPGTCQRAKPFPPPGLWPSDTYGFCDKQDIYLCPDELEVKFNVSSSYLAYVNPTPVVPPAISISLDAPPNKYFNKQRINGPPPYWEYWIEDNPGSGTSPPGYPDNDGIFTLTDDGVLTVLGTYNGKAASNCGENNQIWLNGQPLWPDKPRLADHRDQPVTLGPGRYPTNYGINSHASRYACKGGFAVLMDYKELTADPDVAKWAQTQQLLNQSARHVGRINVLMSDLSVSSKMSPAVLNPAVNPALWDPPNP